MHILRSFGVLISITTVIATMGCSSNSGMVIGPSPRIPLSDPQDYRTVAPVMSNLKSHGVVLWKPVGVRKTDDAIAVDFVVEASDSHQAVSVSREIGDCFNSRTWLGLADTEGEALSASRGCGVTLIDKGNFAGTVSLITTWFARDTQSTSPRYFTSVIFSVQQPYLDDAILVRIVDLPGASGTRRSNAPTHTSREGLAAPWNEWIRLQVVPVEPWSPRR